MRAEGGGGVFGGSVVNTLPRHLRKASPPSMGTSVLSCHAPQEQGPSIKRQSFPFGFFMVFLFLLRRVESFADVVGQGVLTRRSREVVADFVK